MAEIKSALEIALERAAALGAGEDDSKRQAREKGRALARQCLEGDLTGPELAAQLSGLGSESTAAAVGVLLEALDEGRTDALPALEALCAQGPARQAFAALAQAQDERAEALDALETDLAHEMRRDLAALGIGGDAARPNPAAHPDYEARCDEALAAAQTKLKAVGRVLRGALSS